MNEEAQVQTQPQKQNTEIAQKLNEGIKAYGDATVSGNSILINLAIANLNEILGSFTIVTQAEREQIGDLIREKNETIQVLEDANKALSEELEKIKEIDAYPVEEVYPA